MERYLPNLPLPEKDAPEISAESFEMIRQTLKTYKNFNLDIYKDKCIKRRINIRIRATHCANAEEYCQLLQRKETELELLLKVLTIHVSQFFRNPPTFAKLRTDIYPYLFDLCRREGRDRLRNWSVGCAGGEEPYSLAILLQEHFTKEMERIPVSILATDVDYGVLDMARAGAYGEERVQEASEDIQQKYFTFQSGKFHLQQEIREMVEFRQSDLFDTASYVESDLILCRNVLIYFERQQQEKILHGFADHLHRGGILVLGKSETMVGETRRRFQTVCPVERIYKVI